MLKLAPEVSRALSQGQPVVALESTIISHGKSPSDAVTCMCVNGPCVLVNHEVIHGPFL